MLITEQFSAGGKMISREADVDPSVPRPGESASQHALRGMKAIVDMHCANGDPRDAVKVAVGYLASMDPVDVAEAEDYLKDKTGATKEAIRAQSRTFRKQFPEPKEVTTRPAFSLTPEHLTDLGNARRLVAEHGSKIRYVAGKATWIIWDGTRWAEDETGEIFRLAKATVAAIYAEASRITDDDKLRAAIAKHALRSESERAIKAMVALAQTEPGIPVLINELDPDPWILNCLNGTIELKTGTLREHRPHDMITKLAPVEYRPQATSELWNSFLWTAAGGETATDGTKADVFQFIEFLAKAAGSALVGENPDEHFFFVYGPPATGKSTWLEAIGATLGDYARTADFEAFIHQRQPRETRSSIIALVGSRFVRSSEVDKGKRLAEGILNAMSGGDRIRARDLHSKSVEFRPSWKLFLAANHRPKLSDDERDGIWRRILQLPFNVQIAAERRDPEVKRTLTNPAVSGSAILTWLIQGCLAWQCQGLHPPRQVLAATDAYRREMDPLAEFTAACIEATGNPGDTVGAKALWDAYGQFSGSRGGVSWNEFGRRMGAKFTKSKTRHGVCYIGIRLIAECEWA